MNGLTLVAPWALAGLALVALPILIHLMGKSPARALRFPSLRFVTPSQLLPRRRSEVRDPLLLVLRVFALAAAAFALAAPARRGAPPVADAGGRTLVVIVDTTRSVMGGASERAARLAELSRIADSASGGATASTLVRASDLRSALAGAAARLATAPGERSLLILSDFQLGALDSAALAAVPAGVTLVFRRLSALVPGTIAAEQGGAALSVGELGTSRGVEASWVRAGAAPRDSSLGALAGATEQPIANALLAAARVVGAPGRTAVGSVAIVFPSYERRAELERGATSTTAPWQRDIVARLAATTIRAPFTARAEGDSATGRLLIFTSAPAASDDALGLALALRAAMAGAEFGAELEPRPVDDATLARWRQSASGPAVAAASPLQPPSHGPATRWLWLAALTLLLVEWWARRRPATPSSLTAPPPSAQASARR